MEALYSSFIMLVLVIVFLGTGVWVFVGILFVSAGGLFFLTDFPLDRIGSMMAKMFYKSSGGWEIASIPLFMWMGELFFHTDISKRLFNGLAPLVNNLPGRLLHTNVVGCALFAAVSGSSAATSATMAKITIPELRKRKYDTDLALGSMAGSGTFGLMIPPSIIFIIYGVLAEVSIAKLFLAGVLPGLLFVGLYSGYIIVRSTINPTLAPVMEKQFELKDYIDSIIQLFPIFILMFVVLGSIYSGLATPTEAAAVGVVFSLIIIAILGQLNKKVIMESLLGAVRTSCLVGTLISAAAFMSTAIGFLHIPQEIAAAIGKFNLSPFGLIFILGIFYIVLGFFLEGTSITVMSLPICLPLAVSAGFDPIWFGVFLVAMTELAQITPPVGFNLFVLQGITGLSIGRVAKAALPFFILMLVGVLLITIFPQIALWLPSLI